jgi:hypothetical protein
MTLRRPSTFLTALLAAGLAAGVVACGSDEGGGAEPDETLPPVTESPSTESPSTEPPVTEGSAPPSGEGYVHPTGADEIVIEYAEVGGFVPVEVAFQQLPSLLVAGDGQAFTPGAQIAIFPAPMLPAVQVQSITEAGIQELLAAADEAGLLAEVDYDERMDVADATTARLTINVDGETYVHEAYALGIEPLEGEMSPERQALADFIAELRDLPALVGADQLGETALYEPATYGIQASAVDDLSAYGDGEIEPTVVDWPAEAGVALADASECTIVEAAAVQTTFAEANQLTFFDDAGTTYQVLVKPILPGTDC